MCNVIVPNSNGAFNGNCPEPPTRTGTWKFDYPTPTVKRIALCDGTR